MRTDLTAFLYPEVSHLPPKIFINFKHLTFGNVNRCRERRKTSEDGNTARHRQVERQRDDYTIQKERQGVIDGDNQRQRGRGRITDKDGNFVGKGKRHHHVQDGKTQDRRTFKARNRDGKKVQRQQRSRSDGTRFQKQERQCMKKSGGTPVQKRRVHEGSRR